MAARFSSRLLQRGITPTRTPRLWTIPYLARYTQHRAHHVGSRLLLGNGRLDWRMWAGSASVLAAGVLASTYLLASRDALYLEAAPTPSEDPKDVLMNVHPHSTKPHLVILGSGWGASSLLKNLKAGQYDVTVVSPTNYFLFTPLLPSATVGTLDLRSLVEPTRKMLRRLDGRYLECEAIDVDFEKQTVQLQDQHGRKFSLPYDKLVIAVGSETNSMGVKGVEYCHQLKTLKDADDLRRKIMANFEQASLPTTTEEERKRLLNFVVCGGGPTGVEFAAELYDFLTEDLVKYFPELPLNEVKVSIIQSQDHILNTYDRKLSEYAAKHFARTNVNLLTRSRVIRVEPDRLIYKVKGPDGKLLDEEQEIPFGLCLWATGVGMRPFTRTVQQKLGSVQEKHRTLVTDPQLRVRGTPNNTVYAIGDCATIENPRLFDHIQNFFKEADTNKNGTLDLNEFESLCEQLIVRYPQTEEHLNKMNELFETFDVDRSGELSLDELEAMFKTIDRNMTTLPATAQVASQQGAYLAKKLNKLADRRLKYQNIFPDDETVYDSFKYVHRGSLAYIGNAAIADFGNGYAFGGSGAVAKYLWRGVYWNEQVSIRTRMLLALDWAKELIFGRDVSRI